MVKKLFALASVSALAGLMAATGVAGCSTTEEAPGGETTKDAGKDTGKKTETDAATGDDDDDDDVVKQCWKDDEVDTTEIPYKPPTINNEACGDDVMTQLKAYFKTEPNATLEQIQTFLKDTYSEDCAACVIGDDSGDTWAPIVIVDDQSIINKGGCVSIVSGKEECGEAYHKWYECITASCSKCEEGSDAEAACYDAISDTACKPAAEAIQTECGKSASTYISACGKGGELLITGPVEKQCTSKGATVKDAATGG